MTLDLKGKRVVVTGGKHPVEQAIAEAVAQEGADVVIWLRKWNDDGTEAKVLPIAHLEIPSQRPNGASPHTSLWPVKGKTQILLVTPIPGCRSLRFSLTLKILGPPEIRRGHRARDHSLGI